MKFHNSLKSGTNTLFIYFFLLCYFLGILFLIFLSFYFVDKLPLIQKVFR